MFSISYWHGLLLNLRNYSSNMSSNNDQHTAQNINNLTYTSMQLAKTKNTNILPKKI